MLGGVFRNSTKMSLEDMVPIQVRHFPRGLDPNLELGVLVEVIQSCDVKSEFSGFCELAETDSERQELISRD